EGRAGVNKPLSLCPEPQVLPGFLVQAATFRGVKQSATHDSIDNPWSKIVTIIEMFDRLDDFLPRQTGVFQVGKLVTKLVGHRIVGVVVVLLQVIIELRARVGVSDRNLNGFAVQLLCKLHRALNGLLSLAGQANDEISVDDNTQALAVLHEFQPLLDRRTLFYVLQNLWISRFKSYDHQPAAGFLHRLQGFVVGVHPRRARPGEPQRLQLLAQIQDAVLPPGKSIIIKEDLFDIRKQFQRPPNLSCHVLAAAYSPGMAADCLRPQTKSTQGRAAARRVKRQVRMKQEGY